MGEKRPKVSSFIGSKKTIQKQGRGGKPRGSQATLPYPTEVEIKSATVGRKKRMDHKGRKML